MPGRTVTATLKADVSGYIASMNRAAGATRDFASKANASVGRHKEGIDQLSRASGLMGAVVGAGVGLAVKSFDDFDQAMSSVAATGADAKANMGALKDAAIQAGAATKYSATEAAGGIEALEKAGVASKDVLGGGLTGALNLAAAGNLSVADSAEAAATAMTQFGLKGKDVPHIADLLAAGAGKAQGEVSDMAAALNQTGLVASQMGLSIEDTTGSLAAFASAGLVGSDAGTSFKTMLQRLSNPTAQASATMTKLGISAYDAQGNFVGITNLAEQLKEKLGPLTQAQRNAALATIFGSDAIRAANVLYTQGGAGISNWIGQVNDSGFASRVAGDKAKNLAGDLEQLTGSFETAMIGLGEGANGPLRSLTQSLTSAVNTFNDLGSGSKSALLLVGGGLAALALGAAGIGKIVIFANEAKAALVGLGVSGASRAAGAVNLLRTAAIGAGVAFAGLVAANAIGDHFSQQAPKIEDMTNALSAFGTAVPTATTNLDQFFNIALRGDDGDTSHIDGIAQAFDRVQASSSGFTKANDAVSGFLHSIVGGSSDIDLVRQRFVSLDQAVSDSFSKGDTQQAALGFQQIATQAAKAHVPIDQLVSLFPQYKKQLEDQASALHVSGLSAQDWAGWMAGTIPSAIKAAQAQQGVSQSVQDLAPAIASTRDALAGLAQGSRLTADQSQKLAQAVFAEGDAYQNTITAHSAYADAIDQASSVMKKNGEYLTKNGKALSDNSVKGRENIAALNNLASSGKAYVQSLIAQGASSKTAQRATQGVRDEFIKTARAAGLSKGAAADLANSYGLIPKKVSTEFDAFGIALQQQKVAEYQATLAALPKDVRAKIEAVYQKDGAKAAIAELDKITKPHKAPVNVKAEGAAKAGSDIDKAAKARAAHLRAQADNIGKASGDLNKVASKKRTANIGSKATTGPADSALNSTAAKKRTATIRSAANTAGANGPLNSVAAKRRTARINAQATGVGAVNAALNSAARSRTATIRVTTVKRTQTIGGVPNDAATGGLITPYGTMFRGPLRRSIGGPVWGAGTATSDSIPALLSNGEFVLRAAAVKSIGMDVLTRLNAQGYATGGLVPGLATGGLPSGPTITVGDIYRLIRALQSPIADINAAAAAVKREQAKIAKPTAAKVKAEAAYETARDKQENLKDKVNRLAKEAAATKGVTKADRDLKKARLELSAANNKVSKTSRDKTAAEKAYNDVADPLKTATEQLTAAQNALADSARSVSDSFSDQYRSTSTDAADWIDLMKTGTTDLVGFTQKIADLRKSGLSETLIQQIVGMGATAGTEIATQIAAGGKSLVDSLNQANAGLQNAADNLGYLSATGPKRGPKVGYATGTLSATRGLAWVGEQGPELVEFRGGEVVHTASASRVIVDSARQVVSNNYARSGYAGMVRQPSIDMATVRSALAGANFYVQSPIDGQYFRAFVRTEAHDVLEVETGKVATRF